MLKCWNVENNPLKICMFFGKQRDWLYGAISKVIFILKIPKFSPNLFVNILSRFFLIGVLSARFKRCIQYNNALQFLNVTWLQCIKVKRRRSFRWISKVLYLWVHNSSMKFAGITDSKHKSFKDLKYKNLKSIYDSTTLYRSKCIFLKYALTVNSK